MGGGSGGGGKSGRGSGGGGGSPEQQSQTLLNNLREGKISISDANAAHDTLNKEFMSMARIKNRTESENKKMATLSDNVRAMEHAINTFERGNPDFRKRRF